MCNTSRQRDQFQPRSQLCPTSQREKLDNDSRQKPCNEHIDIATWAAAHKAPPSADNIEAEAPTNKTIALLADHCPSRHWALRIASHQEIRLENTRADAKVVPKGPVCTPRDVHDLLWSQVIARTMQWSQEACLHFRQRRELLSTL